MLQPEIQAWINTILAATSLLGVLYVVAVRIAKMEVKVDTIWNFMMRRAVSEAFIQGVATKNSPITITEEAKNWMLPLVGPIKNFYRSLGRNLTDSELAMEIERRFGDQILNEVCIPHGLHMGACLLIALEAAKS